MGELLAKLFDIGKLPSKVVLLVFFVAGVVFFAPSAFHDKLDTKALLDRHGVFVGVTFIAATALLILNVSLWLLVQCRRLMAKWRWKRDVAQAIADLDHAEIAVLREFFIQGKGTLLLPIDEPTVAGLISKGMVGCVGRLGRQSVVGMLFPVSIDPDLRRALQPRHLGIPSAEPTCVEVERILSERPGFMWAISRVEELRSGW